MATRTLLVEIGTEELPPKSLKMLAQAFHDNFESGLQKSELEFSSMRWLASPRRLALQIEGLVEAQADKVVEKRGPSADKAFDPDGTPTKAAQGWARSNGIEVNDAERLETDKGTWLLHRAKVPGRKTQDLIIELIEAAVSKLPVSKPMRWGSGSTQFIRPVHTVCVLYGDCLVEGEILGQKTSCTVRGHRFMGTRELILKHADEYSRRLEYEGKVIVDFEKRRSIIREGAQKAADLLGGRADIEDDLLDEVTSLVEWPVVLSASFEPRFLEVPAEALVSTMKGDQRYFPIHDDQDRLLPHFIFVANLESKDPAQVIAGNEKVVRPRLADAEFFFKSDRKHPLVDRLPELDSVLFQKQLGSVREKSERITRLASVIAKAIGADQVLTERAGLLSKCDLMTSMVFEFTDTQGVMGMHYARHDGEAEEVAQALNEQYLPRFAGDVLPSSPVSQALAIADRIDTMVGIFGIGQLPKGDRDPFALRRAALGVLRIIVEKDLPLDLVDLVHEACVNYEGKLTHPTTETDVIDFMLGRFRAWYVDEGIDVDIILAVLARRPTRPADFDKRVKAVSHFRSLPEAVSLAAANKRIGNILAKFSGALQPDVCADLLQDPEEKALARHLTDLERDLAPVFEGGAYREALSRLASLREPVDIFFDKVLVMAEDEGLKLNRLTMLSRIQGLFLRIADISILQS